MTKKKPLPGQTSLFGAPPVPPPPIAVPAPPTVAERLEARPLKPRRKRGSPGPADMESAARDEALDMLDAARSRLIAEARKIVRQLVQQRGRVTSVEVFQVMRSYGYDAEIDAVDSRWMGCVFKSCGLVEAGWENTGSHRRPVRIWAVPTSELAIAYAAHGAQAAARVQLR